MEFINYVRSFYGPGGIYDMKATDAMIIDATMHYITEGGYKFCGDSFDREHVRDIMIERFGLVPVGRLSTKPPMGSLAVLWYVHTNEK